jgi:hypothetical protein
MSGKPRIVSIDFQFKKLEQLRLTGLACATPKEALDCATQPSGRWSEIRKLVGDPLWPGRLRAELLLLAPAHPNGVGVRKGKKGSSAAR